MAEEDLNFIETAPNEPAPLQTGPFKLTVTKDEFSALFQDREERSLKGGTKYANGVQGVAMEFVDILRNDPYLKDRMDYYSLRTGEAPILKELGIEEGKSLNDAQIIQEFAMDDKGQPIVVDPSFFQGVKRRALPSTGFAGGFFGGAKATNLALSGVPPTTLPTALLRISAPIIGGILGGSFMSEAGEEATNVLMGEEPIIVPGTKSDYEAGKTFADTLPFILTPWTISKKGIDLGGKVAVDNAVNNFIGPIMRGQSAPTPLAAKSVEGLEKTIQSLRPQTTAESIKAGAIELSALAGTTFFASEAEKLAPDNPWVRFAYETAGGVSGAVAADFAANRVPLIYEFGKKGVLKLWQLISKKDPSALSRKYGITEGQLDDVQDFILEQLEKNGEDPEAILNALNDEKFDKFLFDEDGRAVQLDTATKAASVTLLALQNQFMGSNPQDFGSSARERMKSGVDALRRAILALYADGSQEALQEAAVIQTSLFEGALESKVAAATNKTIEAIKTVRGDHMDRDNAEAIFKTVDSLYENFRDDESRLWMQIPITVETTRFIDKDGVESDTPNFIKTWRKLLESEIQETKQDLGLTEGSLAIFNNFVNRKTKELGLDPTADSSGVRAGVSAKELYKMRQRALSRARQFAANGQPDERRIALEMADALELDMNSFPAGVSQKYDTARSYSKAFNDVFTRMFAGDLRKVTKTGAPAISLEKLRNTMMKGDAALIKASQLDAISQFGAKQALTTLLASEVGPEFVETGKTLLAEFEKTIDPNTSSLDLEKMRDWYGDNKEAIKAIPGLNERISAAMNSAIELRNAEEVLLRSIRADALNPDGTLSTTGLSNWMNQKPNERLLKMFPAVEEDLQDVRKAHQLLVERKRQNTAEQDAERAGIGLYELLPNKTDNPATVLAEVLSYNQPKPFTILNRYARLIDDVGENGFTVSDRNSPNKGQTWTQEELRDGLRKHIYDVIFDVKSNGKKFSTREAYNQLFVPHPNGKGVSIAEWMSSNKLVDEDMLKDIKTFMQQMAKIELFASQAQPGDLDVFYKDVGEGVLLLSALGGSVGGSRLRSMLGGEDSSSGSIIAAGAGAKYAKQLARRYMADLPQSLQANRVRVVLENEDLLRIVLAKGKTEREKNALLNRAGKEFSRAFILDPTRRVAGEAIQETFSADEDDIMFYTGEEDVSPPDPKLTPPQQRLYDVNKAQRMRERAMNPPAQAIPTPSRGPAPRPVQPPPAPVSAAPQPSGQVDRARFAALFPEDRDLISGIGSLMGRV